MSSAGRLVYLLMVLSNLALWGFIVYSAVTAGADVPPTP